MLNVLLYGFFFQTLKIISEKLGCGYPIHLKIYPITYNNKKCVPACQSGS